MATTQLVTFQQIDANLSLNVANVVVISNTANNCNPISMIAGGQAANNKVWGFRIGSGADLQLLTMDDITLAANGGAGLALDVTRSGNSISNINIGNATVNPNTNFQGTGTVNFTGQAVLNSGFGGSNVSNGTFNSQLTNSSNGTLASVQYVIQNNLGHNAYLGISGGSFAGSEWSSGPTGEQVYIGGSGNIPVVFGSNNTYRGQIDGSGHWTIAAPTSGTALTVTGISGNVAIQASTGSIFQGQPSVCAYYMNSPGAAYGTIQNDSSNTWSLGFTITSPSISQAVGTPVVQWSSVAGVATVKFPGMGTTGIAVNAVIDSGNNNTLLRNSSSIRYKMNVETMWSNVANKIFDMRPVWYRSNPNTTVDSANSSWYGLIAEEVAAIEPRLVSWTRKDPEDPNTEFIPEGVAYDRITVLLIDVIKRQEERIKAQEERIKALEDALSKLNTKG
jgi:hypothetical protein